jgi:hypothetical protein
MPRRPYFQVHAYDSRVWDLAEDGTHPSRLASDNSDGAFHNQFQTRLRSVLLRVALIDLPLVAATICR